MINTVPALAVGTIRALTGVAFLAAPRRPAEAWVGETSRPVQYLVRSVGGRDLVIGAGVIAAVALDHPVWPWLTASIVGDLVDAGASTVMLDGRPRRNTLAFAGGFAVLGGIALARALASDD
jgi:hypothetical protein